MALSRSTRVNILIGNGHFLSHFYVICLPPLFLAWRDTFHVTFAEVALATAMMSGTTAILQTPVGFLVDRYGARPFLVGGTLLMSLSVAAMSQVTAFWQIPMLAVLSGVGNSVIHPADYAILSGSVDPKQMGKSFALHTFSGNLGGAIAPPIIALLTVAIGWRHAMLMVGLLGIPVVISILLQSGILQDQTRVTAKTGGVPVHWREALFSRSILLFFTFFLLGSMAGGGVQSWLVTVLHTVKGMDLKIASTALTTYMVGMTSGVLVGGWFVDHHRKHVLAFAATLTTLSAVVMLAVNWLPPLGVGVWVMTFISGTALGASRTPRDVMLRDAAPPGQIGKVFGFVSAGLPLGGAITPVPFGYLIDKGHPELVLVLVAVLLLLSLFCAGTARKVAARDGAAVAAAGD
jgi:MFS transporter, FSR family, fosmidomycin resistance protein